MTEHREVDQPGGFAGQVVAGAGDVHGLPGADLPGPDPVPQPGVAVAQVEGVGDELFGGAAAGAAQGAELVDGVLGDVGATVAAVPDRAFDQRFVAGCGGFEVVHVGPPGGEDEDLALPLAQLGFVRDDARGQVLAVHPVVSNM